VPRRPQITNIGAAVKVDTPKQRKQPKPRDLRQFDDPHVVTAEVCALVGGRSGGSAHPNTIYAMVADGRLPRPDIPARSGGPNRWRMSNIVKALRRLEQRHTRQAKSMEAVA
jgi:hypothetical protein